MAFHCLDKLKVGNTTYNLLQINDFSVIPASIIDATSFSDTKIYGNSQSKPSWVSDTGDTLYAYSSSTSQATSVIVKESQYIRLLCPSGIFNTNLNGLRTYNKISGSYLTDFGTSTGNRNYYIGVVFDDINKRGYLLICTYTTNMAASSNGWQVYCCGGLVNGIDYVNETFKDVNAGAGSGYIGNSLLSNKKMVGYNVPTSSAESTKTESVNEVSESPVSGKPKIGNGYAKIKLLRQAKTVTLKELLKTTDFTHIKDCRNSTIPTEYLGTDWLFMTGQTYGRLPSWDDTNEVWYANEDHAHAQYVGGHAFAPIKPCYIRKAKFDLKFTTTYDGNPFAFYAMKISNNAMADSGTLYPQITQNADITDYEVTFNPPIKADYFHVYCGGSIADIIYQISNMTLEVIEI